MSALALKAMNSIAASPGSHSAFIKSDGSLWTMGKRSGTTGQLDKQRFFYPHHSIPGQFCRFPGKCFTWGGVSIAAFDFAKVAIGGGHTIYVSTEGGYPGYPPAKYAYTSGRNTSGQLGNGNNTDFNNFQFVPTYLVNNQRVIDGRPVRTIHYFSWKMARFWVREETSMASSASATKTTRQAYRAFSPPAFAMWQPATGIPFLSRLMVPSGDGTKMMIVSLVWEIR